MIKENIKASLHWTLWGEFTSDRWIPRTKGQQREKCFHLMMSSWNRQVPNNAAENAKSWVAQWTTHGWLLGGTSQFWVVCQSIICSQHEINLMVNRRQSESEFYLGTSNVTNGYSISVNIMSSFILKYILQNLKNSLVAKWTIAVGTLGHTVDSWVAFGTRGTIFQQHCTKLTETPTKPQHCTCFLLS